MADPLIKLTGVSKRFSFSTVLKEISTEIEAGGIIGLIGRNGSGKTTFMKLVAGLLQPSKGKITVKGKATSRLTAASVAFLSEENALYDFYTIKEHFKFADRVFSDFNLPKAQKIAQELNLEKNKRIGDLSKGDKTKVQIITAISRNVLLVLMDEPLSGLDPIVRADILKLLARHAETERQTIMISTHEVQEVEPLLDKVMVLRNGILMLSADVEQLREEKGQSVLDTMKEVLS